MIKKTGTINHTIIIDTSYLNEIGFHNSLLLDVLTFTFNKKLYIPWYPFFLLDKMFYEALK